MASSVPPGQTDVDDWFDLDKYREDAGEQDRKTIGKKGTEQRTSASQEQEFRAKDEERDYNQAQRAYRY